jgi:hypothetical protein
MVPDNQIYLDNISYSQRYKIWQQAIRKNRIVLMGNIYSFEVKKKAKAARSLLQTIGMNLLFKCVIFFIFVGER